MPQPRKPPALRPGDAIRVLSLASPVEKCLVEKGRAELQRLGYSVMFDDQSVLARDGYFAGSTAARLAALKSALVEPQSDAIFCSRGGYGSNYLLDGLSVDPGSPRILLGHSDITSLQIYLWQKFGWVTFHGPMVASGFANGPGVPNGYDRDSLLQALTETSKGWTVGLDGESLVAGSAVQSANALWRLHVVMGCQQSRAGLVGDHPAGDRGKYWRRRRSAAEKGLVARFGGLNVRDADDLTHLHRDANAGVYMRRPLHLVSVEQSFGRGAF